VARICAHAAALATAAEERICSRGHLHMTSAMVNVRCSEGHGQSVNALSMCACLFARAWAGRRILWRALCAATVAQKRESGSGVAPSAGKTRGEEWRIAAARGTPASALFASCAFAARSAFGAHLKPRKSSESVSLLYRANSARTLTAHSMTVISHPAKRRWAERARSAKKHLAGGRVWWEICKLRIT